VELKRASAICAKKLFTCGVFDRQVVQIFELNAISFQQSRNDKGRILDTQMLRWLEGGH